MNSSSSYGPLFRKTLLALLLCAGLVVVCYQFIDRPFALFVHEEHFSRYAILKWLTKPPPFLQKLTPLAITLLMIRRAWGPFHRCELTLLAACVALVLGEQFRQSISFVFGRDWPNTWIDHNPSLIENDKYGFHFFDGSIVYDSFPSGHMTRTLAVASVVWIAYPCLRWLCVPAAAAVAVGLLGLNYHFVGDVIAGSFLGGIVGTYMAYFCGLTERPEPATQPEAAATQDAK